MGELRESDLRIVREQLGRDPTVGFSVVARCFDGHPFVIRNDPYDPAGRPFPTLFWLTCPDAVKAVSRVESIGRIRELNERASTEVVFGTAVAAAHQEYASERARGFPGAEAFGGVGGTRAREAVKCLHAHYANHFAGGEDPVGAIVAEEVEPIHAEERPGRVAAIDLGTNSIRLLVVEPRGANGTAPDEEAEEPAELARDMVITRIGEGVDETGSLDPEARARTVRVLERYCRRARALHAERIQVSATSAVRDVSDRSELEAAVRLNAGSELAVVSGEREAALSFLGATRGLDRPAPWLVLDIGGGSTEFVLGSGDPEVALSVRMGSVRLTERFIHADPPTSEELEALGREIDGVLKEAERSIPVSTAATFVPVGGTATTIQAISLDLGRYDPDAIHRTELSRAEVERVLGDLARMTNDERAAIPVMAPGRGDVIVAGAEILAAVMRRWGFDVALVSERDILDGLAAELLATR